jgi:glycosyltransferase involved in cell wall biosynthesis
MKNAAKTTFRLKSTIAVTTWGERAMVTRLMIEAMACGTPVLALRSGSVPEIVRDGVSGYVSGRTSKLVAYLRDLRLDPVAVRRYVERNFSLERMARDYCSLYAEILNNSLPAVSEAKTQGRRAIGSHPELNAA